jgi:Ca2+-binding EF-hand superfamily protein
MTRFARLSSTTVIFATIGAVGFAAADPGRGGGRWGPGPAVDFTAIDTDQDGSLTRAELIARAQGRLATADANGDAVLDRDEIIAQMPDPHDGLGDLFGPDRRERAANRILAAVGGTEAGQVSIEDLADHRVNMMFAFVDEDGDGAITEEEVEVIGGRHRQARSGYHHGRGGPGEFRGDRMGRPGPDDLPGNSDPAPAPVPGDGDGGPDAQ